MKYLEVMIDEQRCNKCNYCQVAIDCPGVQLCTGCDACIDACPQEARKLKYTDQESNRISCSVNGLEVQISERRTVLHALDKLGFEITQYPAKEDAIFAPCRTGGCYSCAVLINGQLRPSCITPVHEGMVINTQIRNQPPLRIVTGFQGHHVGGVGTPKDLVSRAPLGYLEVACFSSGCTHRCSTCQNWQITYLSHVQPLSPVATAHKLTEKRKQYQVDRMAISGGESTLNRRWLVQFVKQLKKLNPDKSARIHVDTNAAILTPDYIDELVEAGMTDIGPDLKGISLDTFTIITNQKNEELAEKYLTTSWNAVKYILDQYSDKVFLGVGIPYNSAFMSLDEVNEIGSRLVEWDSCVQVTVLDYRPEFRARAVVRPSYKEMLQVKNVLEGTGLEKVICQTSGGYIR
ncbi:MAG: radical SAM protein [Candidatus Heimdallarchaeota archaeon]|nr:MAG: radical SAM protein [Candidatus Heimdallarchaeota archaeon]